MPLIDLIRVLKLFRGANLLIIEVISDPKWLGKDPRKFRRLRVKNREEKTKISSDGPRGAALTKARRDSLYLLGSSAQRLSEFQGYLKTSFSQSFCTSSQVMYPHFVVDSNF